MLVTGIFFFPFLNSPQRFLHFRWQSANALIRDGRKFYYPVKKSVMQSQWLLGRAPTMHLHCGSTSKHPLRVSFMKQCLKAMLLKISTCHDLLFIFSFNRYLQTEYAPVLR